MLKNSQLILENFRREAARESRNSTLTFGNHKSIINDKNYASDYDENT
jgi:hypothetical protein